METGLIKLELLVVLEAAVAGITAAKVEHQELLEKEMLVVVLDLHMVMLLLEAVAVKVKLETQTELLKVELILRLVAMVETAHKALLLVQRLTTLVEELEDQTHLLMHLLLHKPKVAKVAAEMVMEIGTLQMLEVLKLALLILAVVAAVCILVELLEKLEALELLF